MASPAFAQKRHAISPQVAAAQAYAPSDSDISTVDSYTVIVNGQIVGRDPDPNVRLKLRRDLKADASCFGCNHDTDPKLGFAPGFVLFFNAA